LLSSSIEAASLDKQTKKLSVLDILTINTGISAIARCTANSE